MVDLDDFSHVAYIPPKHWTQVVDGHRITPRIVQATLRRCRVAGADMEYIAAELGVGTRAMLEYLDNERTIPAHIAERFYWFFVSVKTLPKAPPEKLRPTIWEETAESRAVKRTITPQPLAPDFDAKPLGAILKKRRHEQDMTLAAAAKKVSCSPSYVQKIEAGAVANQKANCKSIYRLCEFFGVDIRDYELKPRVDFPKFQEVVRKAKQAKGESWAALAERAGVSRTWVITYLATRKARMEVTYLGYRVTQIMAAYGLDVNEVLSKKEVNFANRQD